MARADAVDFSLQLLEGQQRQTPAGNVALSPVGVYMALACLANGAEGTALTELQNALGEQSLDAVNAHAGEIAKLCAENPALEMATSLWGRTKPEFAETLREGFMAECFPLPPTSAPMNAWVSKKTKGIIRSIIPEGPLSGDTAAYLLNALYFKDKWSDLFDKELTKPKDFYVNAEGRVQVPMMFREGRYAYFEDADLQAVKLPYKNGLSMTVFLPKDKDCDMEKFVALLREKNKLGSLSKFEKQEIDLYFPKFRMSPPTVDLKGLLTGMGVKAVFDRDAVPFPLPKIDDDVGVFVKDIMQKTDIDVDEEGTVAVSVTVVAFGLRSVPAPKPPKPVFRADHPFVFIIGDEFFAGIVRDPSKS